MEPICNQTKIPKNQWRYGLLPSAAAGCGWIAVYNAMVLTGRTPDIPDIMRRLFLNAPLLNGTAGTMPYSPGAVLRQYGYHTKTAFSMEDIDRIGRESQVAIVYYFWREGLKMSSHLTTVQFRDGQFWAYNLFRSVTTPFPCGESLAAFLRRQHFFGCFLVGVNE